MAFESVRGYVGLASGLTELTRARALEAARGLLSLPAASIASGSKVAVQAGALADELFSAAAANRSDLKALVRSEVEIAITRLGLVSAQRLDDIQAEAARLRAEVATLRASASASAPGTPTPGRSTAASKPAVKAVRPARKARAAAPVNKAKAAKPARKAQSANPVKNAQSANPAKKALSARPAKKAQSVAKKALSARPAKKAQSTAKKAQSARPVKKAQSAAKKAAKVTAPRRASVTTRARPANA